MSSEKSILREELLKHVESRQTALARLLAHANVNTNIEHHDSLRLAVSRMSFEMLDILQHGKLRPSASYIWESVPNSTSQVDTVRLSKILRGPEFLGEPLDRQLVHATKKKHAILARALLQNGAPVEFGDAAAVKSALDQADLDLLDILLHAPCSQRILSITVPHAMKVIPRALH
jgi:hypothetical protein